MVGDFILLLLLFAIEFLKRVYLKIYSLTSIFHTIVFLQFKEFYFIIFFIHNKFFLLQIKII